MISLRQIAAAMTLALVLFCSSIAAPPKNKLIAQQYFDITASSFEMAKETENHLIKARQDAFELLGSTVDQRISIVVADSREEFGKLTKGALPDWGVGCAIPTQDLIAVISPLAMEYEIGYGTLLRHEWAHIALRDRVGTAYLPRFLNEGFAMYFAHQWSSSYGLTLAKSGLTGSWSSLGEIDRVNFFNTSEAQIAYAQSFKAVEYFLDEYKIEGFYILLNELKLGKSLDASFMTATGATFASFQAEFAKYLKQNYSWWIIFTDMTVVWILLALLIVVGFLLKKRRSRDTVKRWEEEEKYQSTDFDYEEGEPWD